MDLIYLAHPVAPVGDETVASNLDSAERWLVALQRANPGVAFVAPWIQELRLGIGDDSSPEDRARGIARCRAAAARCDGIALCGPRISRGMLAETIAIAPAYYTRRRPVVHRFLDHDQSLVNEQRPLDAPLDEWGSPRWMQRRLYGSVPVTASETAMELLAAYEVYADEVQS